MEALANGNFDESYSLHSLHSKKVHTVKDFVFLPVGLGNLQLHSMGIKPVNIILNLAHTVVKTQVLSLILTLISSVSLSDESVHVPKCTGTSK